jgi:hypothetical protein
MSLTSCPLAYERQETFISLYFTSITGLLLGDPGVDGRIILRWIFRKLEGVVETGWS